jgi:hypothetical protein
MMAQKKVIKRNNGSSAGPMKPDGQWVGSDIGSHMAPKVHSDYRTWLTSRKGGKK